MKRRCSCPALSAFHWADPGYPGHIRWSELNKTLVSSQRSTETVNAKRAEGVDVAHIHGLSDASSRRAHDPKRFHVYMKAKPSHGKN